MDFNINLGKLFNIAKMGGDKTQIDTSQELRETKSLFNNSGFTNPIGDSFTKTTELTTNFQIKSGDDVRKALVEEFKKTTDIDPKKLDEYMSKPMQSIDTLNKAFALEVPEEAQKMAQMAVDIDVNKLNAYLAIYAGENNISDTVAQMDEHENPEDADIAFALHEMREAGEFDVA